MLNTNPRLLMSNFFADYDVIITGPVEFVVSSHDIQADPDGLGGYRLLVNNQCGYFRDIFGEQREFTKLERQQTKLFA
jgi:hypothetical protein